MVCHSKLKLALVNDKDKVKEYLFEEIDYSRKPQLIKKIFIHSIENKWWSLNELFDFLNENHFWNKFDHIQTKSFVFRFQMWNFGRVKKK